MIFLTISVDFLGVNWHAEATMTEGFLSGLETIHRTADVVIGIDKDTDAITIDASLGFNDFAAGYTLYIGVMGLGIDAGAKAIISEVNVHLQASIYITNNTDITNSTSLYESIRGTDIFIDDLDISNEFFIAVDFDGLGLFNFLLDAMGLVAVNVFSGLIFDLIEGPVADALEATLDDVLPEKIAQIYSEALLHQYAK